jgi:RNA-binding protein Musashi
MFIGGLNWETTERKSFQSLSHRNRKLTSRVESLKDYFSQFGEVSECTVMRDSATGRSRGFGFLTFKDPKCVNTVMVKEHYLDGKIVSFGNLLYFFSCSPL